MSFLNNPTAQVDKELKLRYDLLTKVSKTAKVVSVSWVRTQKSSLCFGLMLNRNRKKWRGRLGTFSKDLPRPKLTPLTMRIYLVRHIPTELNESGTYMGRSLNPPILLEARQDFKKTISKLHLRVDDKRTALIFSSPLLRCLQTAKLLRRGLSVKHKIQIVEEFTETDYGDFEGKNANGIKKQYPNLFATWISKPSRVVFPNGESYQDVQSRSYSKLLGLLKSYPQNTLFICTHVDVIKMIISKILSIPIDKKASFRIDNGSFSCLETSHRGFRLRFTNFLSGGS